MLIEKGKGIYSGYKNIISWKSELEYTISNGQVMPVKSRTEIFDGSGELIVVESQDFNRNPNVTKFVREDKRSGKTRKEIFKTREDIVTRLMLSIYIQQFLKSGKTEEIIQVLSNEPKLTKCRLYIAREEEIEVAGKTKKAYKLCLDPQLGLFNFVKVLIPKAYAWHSTKPDFKWLQYKGLEDNLSSPVVEIKKIKDDSI